MIYVEEEYVTKVMRGKVQIGEQGYSIIVDEVIFSREYNCYQIIITISKESNFKLKELPEIVTIQLLHTTLLEQIKIKMKGWLK